MDANPAFDQIPVTDANRPYLRRVRYAHDDLAVLRARLLARLPQALPGWNPALAASTSDHAVLLAELFAQTAAILDAYADQRANESFLRTATLTRSLIDLAELVDYRLGNGASAAALQVFIAKDGKSGCLPAGFRLNGLPGAEAPPLVFETAVAQQVDHTRNNMRLHGFDRSSRVLHLRADPAAAQEAAVLLDAAYSGLKAGIPVVLDSGAALRALPIASVTEVDGATRLSWAPGAAGNDEDWPLAGLTLRGRPQQTARLAAAARADEITLGQNVLPVANAVMFTAGGAVLLDSGGLRFPAVVLAKKVNAGQAPAGTITLNRGVPASLRRSATRVLEGTSCGYWASSIGAGTTVLTRATLDGKKKNFPHTPAPGDTLLIVDAGGVEMATVAQADGILITLTQPIARALRPTSHLFDTTARIRYYCLGTDPAPHQSVLRPLLLGELDGTFNNGHTVLALDKSVDAFAPDTVVALGDGLSFSAHRVILSESVDERTRITLAGSAPAGLRVAFLGVQGAFEHVMHVAGYDRSDGVLAPGTSQLDIAGTPAGLSAGLDLVIADGAHAEGARISQVQPLADRMRVSLSRPLDFGYALGDAVVYGNVARITHGASEPDEILGSGDPAAAPQRFALRRSPLSWLPEPAAARGVAPALEILVAGERWTLVETLAASGPLDRHVVIEIDDRERASAGFGDGVHGAAPPSGSNNIVARYRTGVGAVANVAPQNINKMPQAAPFLERTFNPAPASGGADRESPEQARRQARLRVQTLDRAVSLRDYADLALTYAGVGKALAAVEREGRGAGARRVIVVTCAAEGGNALSTPQKEALLAWLCARSPEPERVRVRDHQALPVRLALTVQVLPDAQQALVQRALLAVFGSGDGGYFSFGERELGADLNLSDVYALAETTPGVDHVLATLFHAEADTPRVAHRIAVPADALATGGHATDALAGRLTLQLAGGLS